MVSDKIQADADALIAACLESNITNWAIIIREVKEQLGFGLREAILIAKYSLRNSKHPLAKQVLDSMISKGVY